MKDVPSIVDFSILPYGNAEPSSSGSGWDCQHGENECIGNMYLACAQEHFSSRVDDVPAWYPFYDCMEASEYNKDRYLAYNTSAAIECAAGIDWSVIEECAGPSPSLGSDDDGSVLMNSIMLNTPNHTYVPWVVVNGDTVPDDGSGYPSGDLTSLVCAAYAGKDVPDACSATR